MTFNTLSLDPALLSTLEAHGYVEPSAVQREVIPEVLAGKDVLATARTGSGKTVAYALPLLQQWANVDRKPHSMSVVLVPTRELAQQVAEVFELLATDLGQPKINVLYGGVSINPQLMRLRGGADVIVATPGRLLDVVDHNGLDLWHTSTLVLDEADRLLDQGFAEELESVLCELPDDCQTLMFSATMPPKVRKMAIQLLNAPAVVDVIESIEHIEQRAIEVDASRRTDLLVHMLSQFDDSRALVFCESRDSAAALEKALNKHPIRVQALYGGLSQHQRDSVLENLKNESIDVLVATDIAARGIDVASLPLVFNYDLPRSTPVYTHRIGRTGRAGKDGVAISFIDADSHAHFSLIEKRTGIQLQREQIQGFEPKDKPVTRNLVGDDNGGIKGKRMSKKDKLRAAAALKAQGDNGAT